MNKEFQKFRTEIKSLVQFKAKDIQQKNKFKLGFCHHCILYTDQIHWCTKKQLYINTDRHNQMIITSKTRDGAAREDSQNRDGYSIVPMPRFAIDDRVLAQEEEETKQKKQEKEKAYKEFIGLVNEKYGPNSAIAIDSMPDLDNINEKNIYSLPRDWQQIKEQYKIQNCHRSSFELESWMKLTRNHKNARNVRTIQGANLRFKLEKTTELQGYRTVTIPMVR